MVAPLHRESRPPGGRPGDIGHPPLSLDRLSGRLAARGALPQSLLTIGGATCSKPGRAAARLAVATAIVGILVGLSLW